jgi:enoyl-[acyl-carrier protein] reductase II
MNNICNLFNINHPIIQAGMVWNSGWRLASASSKSGILGLIGAGSMYPDILKTHIKKCKQATSKPFGVNVPLLYPNIEEIIKIIIDEGVKIVFTSAGNPKIWTPLLKSHGLIVVHVVSSVKFAIKAQEAGVDAIVAEGFEAVGHNGREETTTFTLIPMVKNAISIPLIAAGGIATGRGMLAAMVLGADGVQIGSRFVASEESSAHNLFKEYVINSGEGDTQLTLKEVTPVRMLKNNFYNTLQLEYQKGTSPDKLRQILGKGRAKKGMFEGDLNEGELEIGQVCGLINKIQPVKDIVDEIISDFRAASNSISY